VEAPQAFDVRSESAAARAAGKAGAIDFAPQIKMIFLFTNLSYFPIIFVDILHPCRTIAPGKDPGILLGK
jgi:hypothetical protein